MATVELRVAFAEVPAATQGEPSCMVLCSTDAQLSNPLLELLLTDAYLYGDLQRVVADEDHSRVRLVYGSVQDAARARMYLNNKDYADACFEAHFAKELDAGRGSHLEVPAPTKQFLISPPASPPIGWEPSHEEPPVVNHALVDALMSLEPNTPHVLHQPEGDVQQPIITLTNCVATDAAESSEPAASEPEQLPRVSTAAPPRRTTAPQIVIEPVGADRRYASLQTNTSSSNQTRVMPQTRCPPRL